MPSRALNAVLIPNRLSILILPISSGCKALPRYISQFPDGWFLCLTVLSSFWRDLYGYAFLNNVIFHIYLSSSFLSFFIWLWLCLISILAVPPFTRSFAGLSKRRTSFDLIWDMWWKKLHWDHFFLPVFRIFCVIIPPVLHTHFHSPIILTIDSISRHNTSFCLLGSAYTLLSNVHVTVRMCSMACIDGVACVV